MTSANKFFFFWSGWASQWSKSLFKVDGVEYMNTEQWMMAQKAMLFHDNSTLKKIQCESNPRIIKKLGRSVRNFDEKTWSENCQEIVYQGNLHKFTQNPSLQKLLLETGDKIIAEASPYDKIWGIGLGHSSPALLDHSRWPGKNWLGIALMRVRKTIRDNNRQEKDTKEQEQDKEQDEEKEDKQFPSTNLITSPITPETIHTVTQTSNSCTGTLVNDVAIAEAEPSSKRTRLT